MTSASPDTRVRPGISVLLDDQADLLRGRRVGVLSGPSGVLPDLTSSVDALARAADVRAIFGPEHGLLGAAAEGAHIGDATHPSGAPIYSLYGAQQAPTAEQLSGLDVVVCDIQDIGCRFYTYAWTLVKLMEVAAPLGVAVLVTDRPNPLGGAVEGPGVREGFRTLVGLHDVPISHGLSLGELARLADAELGLGCDLAVVPCQGWRRSARWNTTGLPWAAPSPNMPTFEAALVYPGTCLVEGTNLSVGRGTAKPFEWQGAPWVDGAVLAAALNSEALPGLRWRAVAFTPCSGPHAGAVCQGAQPHVTDADALRPARAGVALLAALRRLHGDTLRWNEAHLDRLAGSGELRAGLDASAPWQELVAGWAAYEAAFEERAAPFRLYG